MAGARRLADATGGRSPRWLDAPERATLEGDRLVEDGRLVARLRPHGSLILFRADRQGRPRRWAELDRDGHAGHVVYRGADGAFEGAAARVPGLGWVGLLAGGGDHPLWGPSDVLVGLWPEGGIPPALAALRAGGRLTVAGRLDWDAVDHIPPLAEPAALPPGAGSALLNLLASLAGDQSAPGLRYRGPFPTEQLFWSLTEAFRVADPHPGVIAAFTAEAEAAFGSGATVEPPVSFVPAPRERLLSGPLPVELRDGVERVTWGGRVYHRPDWSPGRRDLRRAGHRVIRVTGPAGGADAGAAGRRRFEAGLDALGRPVATHVVLAEDGRVEAWPARASDAEETRATAGEPLAPEWREALAALLPLDATPLLAPAIARTWPTVVVSWGSLPHDLVARRDSCLVLSLELARLYRRLSREPAAEPRALARRLAREVLELLGPFVRQAATDWLEAQPAGARAASLHDAAGLDRRRLAGQAAPPLARLLAALAAGEALPESIG